MAKAEEEMTLDELMAKFEDENKEEIKEREFLKKEAKVDPYIAKILFSKLRGSK